MPPSFHALQSIAPWIGCFRPICKLASSPATVYCSDEEPMAQEESNHPATSRGGNAEAFVGRGSEPAAKAVETLEPAPRGDVGELSYRWQETRGDEEKFFALTETVPAVIFIHRDGKFVYINSA